MIKVFDKKEDMIKAFIKPSDLVLDIGFWGQAVKRDDPEWTHGMLLRRAAEVYGVDLEYDASQLANPERYQKASAESFNFGKAFDVVFASELIEHLSNPGLFLLCAKRHLKLGGRLILTTPNCFNLFTVLEKFFKNEPSVNPDHTLYFNQTVLSKLLEKNGFQVVEIGFIDTWKGDGAKRFPVRLLNTFFKLVTPKFLETLVIVAKPR